MLNRATMVTAILPTITSADRHDTSVQKTNEAAAAESTGAVPTKAVRVLNANITSGNQSSIESRLPTGKGASPPRLAGLVGFFTGCGALVALLLFLPLPTQFSHLEHVSKAQALVDSF